MRACLQEILRVVAFLGVVALPSTALAAKCKDAAHPMTVSATTLAFGTYNAASPSATTANATITVSCVNAAEELDAFTIALSNGSAPSFSPRTMRSGANSLMYNIYTAAAFTSIWGDGTGGTVTVFYDGAGKPNSLNYTAYGQVPAGQYVAPGSYTDTITVTVTY